eukprot:TRINITY_DN20167_c0_g1_i1.p1 TRINITY_DN20167_c0_g1~~TRINITY_DN20167_c0_g1_i1.p1  ORF type:complete len:2094 (-),score=367.78 TRINITY_DN20167_c0_g1_i1:13-5703(-)
MEFLNHDNMQLTKDILSKKGFLDSIFYKGDLKYDNLELVKSFMRCFTTHVLVKDLPKSVKREFFNRRILSELGKLFIHYTVATTANTAYLESILQFFLTLICNPDLGIVINSNVETGSNLILIDFIQHLTPMIIPIHQEVVLRVLKYSDEKIRNMYLEKAISDNFESFNGMWVVKLDFIEKLMKETLPQNVRDVAVSTAMTLTQDEEPGSTPPIPICLLPKQLFQLISTATKRQNRLELYLALRAVLTSLQHIHLSLSPQTGWIPQAKREPLISELKKIYPKLNEFLRVKKFITSEEQDVVFYQLYLRLLEKYIVCFPNSFEESSLQILNLFLVDISKLTPFLQVDLINLLMKFPSMKWETYVETDQKETVLQKLLSTYVSSHSTVKSLLMDLISKMLISSGLFLSKEEIVLWIDNLDSGSVPFFCKLALLVHEKPYVYSSKGESLRRKWEERSKQQDHSPKKKKTIGNDHNYMKNSLYIPLSLMMTAAVSDFFELSDIGYAQAFFIGKMMFNSIELGLFSQDTLSDLMKEVNVGDHRSPKGAIFESILWKIQNNLIVKENASLVERYASITESDLPKLITYLKSPVQNFELVVDASLIEDSLFEYLRFTSRSLFRNTVIRKVLVSEPLNEQEHKFLNTVFNGVPFSVLLSHSLCAFEGEELPILKPSVQLWLKQLFLRANETTKKSYVKAIVLHVEYLAGIGENDQIRALHFLMLMLLQHSCFPWTQNSSSTLSLILSQPVFLTLFLHDSGIASTVITYYISALIRKYIKVSPTITIPIVNTYLQTVLNQYSSLISSTSQKTAKKRTFQTLQSTDQKLFEQTVELICKFKKYFNLKEYSQVIQKTFALLENNKSLESTLIQILLTKQPNATSDLPLIVFGSKFNTLEEFCSYTIKVSNVENLNLQFGLNEIRIFVRLMCNTEINLDSRNDYIFLLYLSQNLIQSEGNCLSKDLILPFEDHQLLFKYLVSGDIEKDTFRCCIRLTSLSILVATSKIYFDLFVSFVDQKMRVETQQVDYYSVPVFISLLRNISGHVLADSIVSYLKKMYLPPIINLITGKESNKSTLFTHYSTVLFRSLILHSPLSRNSDITQLLSKQSLNDIQMEEMHFLMMTSISNHSKFSKDQLTWFKLFSSRSLENAVMKLNTTNPPTHLTELQFFKKLLDNPEILNHIKQLQNLTFDPLQLLSKTLHCDSLQILSLFLSSSLLTPSDLHRKLISHPSLLNTLMEESSYSLKKWILVLLFQLYSSDSTLCSSTLLPYLVASYNGSLSEYDRILLNIFYLYEKNGMNVMKRTGYLFGETGKKVLRKELERSNYSLSVENFGMISREVQSMFGDGSLFDPKMLKSTIDEFPITRRLNALLTLEEVKNIAESDEVTDPGRSKYDPSFILPFLLYGVTYFSSFDVIKFTNNQGLAIALLSLSSFDISIRQIGYSIVTSIVSSLEVYRKTSEHWELILLLTRLKNSINQKHQKIPLFTTHFLAKLSTVLNYPKHFLYRSGILHILSKPCLDLTDVPLFMKYFFSKAENSSQQQGWIIESISSSIPKVTKEEVNIPTKRKEFEDILQIVYSKHLLQSLMTFSNCNFASLKNKLTILHILEKFSVLFPRSTLSVANALSWLNDRFLDILGSLLASIEPTDLLGHVNDQFDLTVRDSNFIKLFNALLNTTLICSNNLDKFVLSLSPILGNIVQSLVDIIICLLKVIKENYSPYLDGILPSLESCFALVKNISLAVQEKQTTYISISKFTLVVNLLEELQSALPQHSGHFKSYKESLIRTAFTQKLRFTDDASLIDFVVLTKKILFDCWSGNEAKSLEDCLKWQNVVFEELQFVDAARFKQFVVEMKNYGVLPFYVSFFQQFHGGSLYHQRIFKVLSSIAGHLLNDKSCIDIQQKLSTFIDQ